MKRKRASNAHTMGQNIRYVVRLTWSRDRVLFAMLAVQAVMSMLVPLFGAFFPKLVIDQLQSGASARRIVAVVGGFALASAAVYALYRLASNAKYMRYNWLRQLLLRDLFVKSLTCDYEQVESAEGQTRFERAMNATANGDGSGVSQMVPAIVDLASGVLSFAVFSAVLATLHPLIVVVLTVAAAANYLVMRHARLYEQSRKDENARAARKEWYLIGRAKSGEAAKDVRMYGLRGLFGELFERAIAQSVAWQRRTQARHGAADIAQLLTAALRDGIAYAYLIHAAWTGGISAADAVFYFAAIGAFSAFVTQVLTRINDISTAHLLLDDMRAFLEQPDDPEPDPAAAPPTGAPFSIEFDDVSFAYGPDAPVLEHFSLTIRPGERLALVGVNGAGKTTLVKLLCGLYKPQSGAIRIGGVDIARMTRHDRYALFSSVFQDVLVMPMSFLENVALCEADRADEARALDCLERAGLGDVVRRAPRGLRHGLTRVIEEDGIALSGGETQKLLLARALYRDAPLLVLDEPTAALDPIAESDMYAQYDAFSHGKTSIFISHRLASTRFCDRVVLLQGGRIVEQGTHDELVRRGGAYADMFEIQSHYYRDEVRAGAGDRREALA